MKRDHFGLGCGDQRIVESEERNAFAERAAEHENGCEMNGVARTQDVAAKESLRFGDYLRGQLDHAKSLFIILQGPEESVAGHRIEVAFATAATER